jgi:cobalt/nickel transport system permease protein
MEIIDRHAYNNRLRAVGPVYKVSLVGLTLILCLVLNNIAVGLLAILWMFCLAVLAARIPVRVFVSVLVAEGTFLALTTVGVALSVTVKDPSGVTEWAWRAGPLWLSSSAGRTHLAITLVARALGCTSAMNFLALTTPLVDLIELARRLHVPPVLVDMMTVIYRFIFVLLDSLEQMRTAQESRMGYASFRRGMSSVALLATRLFVETYQRSQRLQTALESRGYVDELRVLPTAYQGDWRLVASGVGIAASLMLARWGL